MIRRLPPVLTASAAPIGAGLASAAVLALATDFTAFGPGTLTLGLAAFAVGAAAPPLPARVRIVGAMGGALLLCTARAWLAAGWQALGTDTLAVVAWALAAAASALLLGALRRGRPWGRTEGLLAVGSGAVGVAVLDRTVLTAAALGLAIVAELGGASEGERAARPPGEGGVARRALAGLLGAGATLAGLVGWSLVRTPLDPTPWGAALVVAPAALALALRPDRRAAGVVVAAVAASAGWLARGGLAEASPALAAHPEATLLTLGLGIGCALAATTGGAATGLGLLAAGLGLAPTLAALDLSVREPATRSAATLLGDPTRAAGLAEARKNWSLLSASVSPTGAVSLRTRDRARLFELDGTPADPATRAGKAETFAGLLAGCATQGRSRIRFAGDDLGLALLAAKTQGFLTSESALPDRELARAASDVEPALSEAWLAVGVRILPVPGPLLLRAGPEADAVVQIARSPWSDARSAFPDPDQLADVRRTLLPGGVHILALATTQAPLPTIQAALRDFVRVYPSASLWLPPDGADTAVLVGPRDDNAVRYPALSACLAAAPTLARSLGLRDADDLAGLRLADADGLRAVPDAPRGGRRLPPAVDGGSAPPLATLPWADALSPLADASPEVVADGAARHRTLLAFLELLRTSTAGQLEEAVARARELATAPGGATAVGPLIRPQLDRVRDAMGRGLHEGPASHAWDEAETALTSARMLAPDFPETRCTEGALALARGQLPRAETAFQACADEDPRSLDAWNGLAQVRQRRGDLVGVAAALTAAHDRHPEDWTTAHRLGVYLLTTGRLDEAERLLLEGAAGADKTVARSVEPHLALGRLYLMRKEPAKALAQASLADNLRSTADSQVLLGIAHDELGQYTAAEAAFRRALEIAPDNAAARNGLGQVQAQQGDYALAAESFKAVLERDPRDPVANESLKRVQALVGAAPPKNP